MAFESIRPIEKADSYIDTAMKKVKKHNYSEIRSKDKTDIDRILKNQSNFRLWKVKKMSWFFDLGF